MNRNELKRVKNSIQEQIESWRRVLTLALIIVPMAYIVVLAPGSDGITRDPELLGQFGDYFGGLLNPLFAAAAFYWLTQSVKLQKEELEATREELKESAKAQADMAASQRATVQLHAMTELLRSTENQIEVISEIIGRLDEHGPQPFWHRGARYAKESKIQLKDKMKSDLESLEESAAGYRDAIRNSHLMRNAIVGHAAVSE